MTTLNDLEIAALRCIAASYPAYPDLMRAMEASFPLCKVAKRTNTGSGFFTDLTAQSSIGLPAGLRSPLGDSWISVKGMRFGICCLLFLTEGYPSLLEGYAVAGEDTSHIDFGRCVFETREAPPTGPDEIAPAWDVTRQRRRDKDQS